MELVALLSTGKGTWAQVSGLVKQGEWDKIIILGDDFSKNFKVEGKKFEFLQLDLSKKLVDLKSTYQYAYPYQRSTSIRPLKYLPSPGQIPVS